MSNQPGTAWLVTDWKLVMYIHVSIPRAAQTWEHEYRLIRYARLAGRGPFCTDLGRNVLVDIYSKTPSPLAETKFSPFNFLFLHFPNGTKVEKANQGPEYHRHFTFALYLGKARRSESTMKIAMFEMHLGLG
ncbi:hypothetical protein PG994_013889 [Apiospora phragmitis]|uniref:Uncharacterized protein n=1 Tax=Apiospora phragmitis TaxID=2905665 RepID=A0ABR1T368_9PEZI